VARAGRDPHGHTPDRASVYSLQRPSARPPGARTRFVFAVKGSRFITHMKRLAGVETALANFFASGVLRLEPLRTSWPAFGRAAARGSAGARGPQL